MVGLITDDDETAYRREVNNPTGLSGKQPASVNKMKELIGKYRRRGEKLDPIIISGFAAEGVSNFVHITKDHS